MFTFPFGYFAASEVAPGGNAAEFDGTNDLITFNQNWGGTATTSGVISFWLKMTGDDGVNNRIILEDDQARIRVRRKSDNSIEVILKKADNTIIKQANTSSTDITVANGWRHFACAWNGTNLQIYLDGSSDISTTTNDNDTIDWGNYTDIGIGGIGGASAGNLEGCLAEFYVNVGEFLDLSSNIGSFISGGEPVDLGSDGSTPTGAQPDVYLKDEYTSFETNYGSKNDGSVVGALTQCSDSPATD